MSREAEVRWWNRAVPVKPIAGLLAILIAAYLASYFFRPTLQSCFWAIGHRSTATYAGLSVKVPWMWRQVETPAGEQRLLLVRARFGEPAELESIAIGEEGSTASGPHALEEGLRAFTTKSGHPDFRGTAISLDPETARHVSCIAPHFASVRDWQASCVATDGIWSANLFGPDPDLDSLRIVLQGVVVEQR